MSTQELTVNELNGLPLELINQLLSPAKTEYITDAIYYALSEMGKSNLDHLLIRLYRDTGAVFNRKTIEIALIHMTKDLRIVEVERGVFQPHQ